MTCQTSEESTCQLCSFTYRSHFGNPSGEFCALATGCRLWNSIFWENVSISWRILVFSSSSSASKWFVNRYVKGILLCGIWDLPHIEIHRWNVIVNVNNPRDHFFWNCHFTEFKMDKYSRIKKIGEGSFGKALLVRCKDSGKQMVVKEINMCRVRSLHSFFRLRIKFDWSSGASLDSWLFIHHHSITTKHTLPCGWQWLFDSIEVQIDFDMPVDSHHEHDLMCASKSSANEFWTLAVGSFWTRPAVCKCISFWSCSSRCPRKKETRLEKKWVTSAPPHPRLSFCSCCSRWHFDFLCFADSSSGTVATSKHCEVPRVLRG